MYGRWYAPETIPQPVVPGSRIAGMLQHARAMQQTPIQVPDKVSWDSALLQTAASPNEGAEMLDPMGELADAPRLRSLAVSAAQRGDESHDGKGNYKKVPGPLEKPEWWLPTPPSWGGPATHDHGGFYGPAQVPSAVLPGAGFAGGPSALPHTLFSSTVHYGDIKTSLLQEFARQHKRKAGSAAASTAVTQLRLCALEGAVETLLPCAYAGKTPKQ